MKLLRTATSFALLALNSSHGFAVSSNFAWNRNLLVKVTLATSEARTQLFNSKWDDLEDEDDEPYQVSPDMKYLPRNVIRQNQHFVDIREAEGPTNDIYVRDATNEIFWFCGKVARVSDISLEECVARQYPLIEQHAANLRPLELSPKRGVLQIWTAPGDSELDIAYNRPEVVMQKMDRDVEPSSGTKIRNMLVGFQGEIYDQGEDGFRTWRTEDGRAAQPEVMPAGATSPSQEGAPSQEELEKLLANMDKMDVSKLYEEQERREGRDVQE